MKTNIRTAKSKLYQNATVFYVPSKSGGQEHIVVVTTAGVFCDCKDFMTRRLPLIGTNGFSLCIHGKQLNRAQMKPASKTKVTVKKPKTYGIFTKAGYRSVDFPGVYRSENTAANAILSHDINNSLERKVHAL